MFSGTADGEASMQEDCENSSEYQIVTEVWIEPQFGYVQMPTQPTATYMHPLQYHQLPDAVSIFVTIADKNFSVIYVESLTNREE